MNNDYKKPTLGDVFPAFVKTEGVTTGEVVILKGRTETGAGVQLRLSQDLTARLSDDLTTDAPKILWYIDATTHVSWRIFINIEEGQTLPDYEKQVLDDLCAWGGRDKSHQCADGSVMYSWEFSKEHIDAVRKFTTRWQSRRNWQEADHSKVWKD